MQRRPQGRHLVCCLVCWRSPCTGFSDKQDADPEVGAAYVMKFSISLVVALAAALAAALVLAAALSRSTGWYNGHALAGTMAIGFSNEQDADRRSALHMLQNIL